MVRRHTKNKSKQQPKAKMTALMYENGFAAPNPLIDDEIRPTKEYMTAETLAFIGALYDRDLVRLKELAYKVPINKRFISYLTVGDRRIQTTPIECLLRGNCMDYIMQTNTDYENEVDLKMFQIFVEAGADINLLDKKGLSPLASILDYGLIDNKTVKLVKFILENGGILIGSFKYPPGIDIDNDEYDAQEFKELLQFYGINCMSSTEYEVLKKKLEQSIIF
jgi:hypothetical protein